MVGEGWVWYGRVGYGTDDEFEELNKEGWGRG